MQRFITGGMVSEDLVICFYFIRALSITMQRLWILQIIALDDTVTCLRPLTVPILPEATTTYSNFQSLGGRCVIWMD